jgi:hypothetical protein
VEPPVLDAKPLRTGSVEVIRAPAFRMISFVRKGIARKSSGLWMSSARIETCLNRSR